MPTIRTVLDWLTASSIAVDRQLQSIGVRRCWTCSTWHRSMCLLIEVSERWRRRLAGKLERQPVELSCPLVGCGNFLTLASHCITASWPHRWQRENAMSDSWLFWLLRLINTLTHLLTYPKTLSKWWANHSLDEVTWEQWHRPRHCRAEWKPLTAWCNNRPPWARRTHQTCWYSELGSVTVASSIHLFINNSTNTHTAKLTLPSID